MITVIMAIAILSQQSSDELTIYQDYKKVLIEARNRASQKSLGIRKRALEDATPFAKKQIANKYSIKLNELDAIILIGEKNDGTLERRSALITKNRAKARVSEELEAISTPVPFDPDWAEKQRIANRYNSGQPALSGTSSIHVGSRGGVYHYSKNGKKNYNKK